MTEHVRVCRECGEEYRPGVAICADCGGALEDRLLDDRGRPIEPAPAGAEGPGPATTNHRVVFLTPRAPELVPLAETLRDAGIAYRLAEQPPVVEGGSVRYALLVEEEHAVEALRALGPTLVPEEHAAEAHAVETRFAAGRGYVECPACGARQPDGAVECPECGLGLGAAAAACARCGEALPEPDADCPSCGASSPR
jgi:hypothetical protein